MQTIPQVINLPIPRQNNLENFVSTRHISNNLNVYFFLNSEPQLDQLKEFTNQNIKVRVKRVFESYSFFVIKKGSKNGDPLRKIFVNHSNISVQQVPQPLNPKAKPKSQRYILSYFCWPFSSLSLSRNFIEFTQQNCTYPTMVEENLEIYGVEITKKMALISLKIKSCYFYLCTLHPGKALPRFLSSPQVLMRDILYVLISFIPFISFRLFWLA